MAPQYLNNNHVLRNNIRRRSMVPRRTIVRNYVRRDVDIRSEGITNKLPELVSKQVLSIPV